MLEEFFGDNPFSGTGKNSNADDNGEDRINEQDHEKKGRENEGNLRGNRLALLVHDLGSVSCAGQPFHQIIDPMPFVFAVRGG